MHLTETCGDNILIQREWKNKGEQPLAHEAETDVFRGDSSSGNLLELDSLK